MPLSPVKHVQILLSRAQFGQEVVASIDKLICIQIWTFGEIKSVVKWSIFTGGLYSEVLW